VSEIEEVQLLSTPEKIAEREMIQGGDVLPGLLKTSK